MSFIWGPSPCSDGSFCEDACDSADCELNVCDAIEGLCDSPEWCCEDPQCLEPIYEDYTFGQHLARLSVPASLQSFEPLSHEGLIMESFHEPLSCLDSIASKDTNHAQDASLDRTAYDETVYTCNWLVRTQEGSGEELCGQLFSSEGELHNHCVTGHVGVLKGKGNFKCSWQGCNRSPETAFSQRGKLERHVMTHTQYKPLVCTFRDPDKPNEICGKKFVAQQALDQHMRVHTGEKPFKCHHEGCGQLFAQSSALTMHLRTHTGEKPLSCPICGRKFSESSNLSKHKKTHETGNKVQCNLCSKTFNRKDQLKRHQENVHERKVRKKLAQNTPISSPSTGMTTPELPSSFPDIIQGGEPSTRICRISSSAATQSSQIQDQDALERLTYPGTDFGSTPFAGAFADPYSHNFFSFPGADLLLQDTNAGFIDNQRTSFLHVDGTMSQEDHSAEIAGPILSLPQLTQTDAKASPKAKTRLETLKSREKATDIAGLKPKRRKTNKAASGLDRDISNAAAVQ